MIVLGGLVFGAALGGVQAARLKGKPADIAQYAAVYGIGFALLGLICTLVIDRML